MWMQNTCFVNIFKLSIKRRFKSYFVPYDETLIYSLWNIRFNLSSDFNASPRGSDWMRLITEWYQNGLIPRSTFLEVAKNNDAIPTDYDDTKGNDEISQDNRIISPREQYEQEINVIQGTNTTEN